MGTLAPGGQDSEGLRMAGDVVGTIAGMAALEVDGVVSLYGGALSDLGERIAGKQNMAKGVKVQHGEQQALIDVEIIVEYGVRIPDVAFNVQEKVKKAVESMTGMEVIQVNVHIAGVSFGIPENPDRITLK